MKVRCGLIPAPLFTRASAYLLHDEARDPGKVAGFKEL
jgi:hypothetical protein